MPMYVPHYDAILHAIGTSRAQLEGNTEVEIPVSLFKHLLQIAVAHGEFNLSGYLAANPDVQDAVRKGKVPDAKLHYIKFGFFEGRRGATPAVDEGWYRRTYTDVAAAIRKGSLTSGSEHFSAIGAEEFRAPSQDHLSDTSAWKTVCGGS